MTPVYFPHTLLDHNEIEMLTTLFDQTVVYTPMQSIVPPSMERWQSEGHLQIRQPMTGDETLLMQQIAAYKQWGADHQRKGKLDTTLLKLDPDRTPFFDHSSTSQIKMDIKSIRSKGTGAEEATAKRADRIRLNTRLFLCMAQHFDQQTRELADDLQACDNQTRQLLAQLRGDAAPLPAETAPAGKTTIDTPGDFMIENRILAWCRLFIEDSPWLKTRPSPFWVTHSSEAVACITDHCNSLKSKAVLGPLTPKTLAGSWKEDFKQFLTDLVTTDHIPIPESLSNTVAAPAEAACWLHLYGVERETVVEKASRPPKLTALIKEVKTNIFGDKPLIIALISPFA